MEEQIKEKLKEFIRLLKQNSTIDGSELVDVQYVIDELQDIIKSNTLI